VIQPRFMSNFSLTVDYYNIQIKHAILEVQAPDILDNCYDGNHGLDPLYCSLFTRDPVSHNVDFIQSTYINASALQTDGIEAQTNYVFWTDPARLAVSTHNDLPGKVSLSMDLNYLLHLRNCPFETDPAQLHIQEGTVGYPQLRLLAGVHYDQGPVSLSWAVRYVGESARFNKDRSQADFAESILPPYVGAQVFYNDALIRFRLPIRKGQAELYFGVNDIFDVQPPIGVIAGNPQGPDGSALYDMGRYIFAGARARF
jgi:outer membrane receptor protein involved in Fe transport